jgi:hypothetical protein
VYWSDPTLRPFGAAAREGGEADVDLFPPDQQPKSYYMGGLQRFW